MSWSLPLLGTNDEAIEEIAVLDVALLSAVLVLVGATCLKALGGLPTVARFLWRTWCNVYNGFWSVIDIFFKLAVLVGVISLVYLWFASRDQLLALDKAIGDAAPIAHKVLTGKGILAEHINNAKDFYYNLRRV